MADVLDWIANPGQNFGWILLGDESSSTSAKRFASRENPNAASRPRLTITYTQPCDDPTVPTLLASVSSFCPGDSIQLSVTAGDLNDAADWQWYVGSCGGTPVGTGASISVAPQTATTYFVRGEGNCVVPGVCGTLTVTPIAFTPADEPMISATNLQFCQGDSVTLTLSGGTLNDSEGWQWYANGCGADSIGTGTSITVAPISTTNYFLRGEGGQCPTPGACGSVTLSQLTVNVDVEVDSNSLEAQALQSTYQWLDCAADFAPIDGATQARFEPGSSGTYAVEITRDFCVDTSSCINFTVIPTSIQLANTGDAIQVWALQGEHSIQVNIQEDMGALAVELIDLQGRVLQSQSWRNGVGTLELSWNQAPIGVYILRISNGAEAQVWKLMR